MRPDLALHIDREIYPHGPWIAPVWVMRSIHKVPPNDNQIYGNENLPDGGGV